MACCPPGLNTLWLEAFKSAIGSKLGGADQ
jgi:hypothetical protein